jgi:hypothetical protein
MFLIGGANDVIVSPSLLIQPLFSRSSVPTIYGVRSGGTHFTAIGDAGPFRAWITAWARLHLMRDDSLHGWFYGADCRLCKDVNWTVQRKGMD